MLHMIKLVAITFCFAAPLMWASAQGAVDFFNNATTLISSGVPQNPAVINATVGAYYFGLLTSPAGANNFTFSGVYGTNQTVGGLFNGGTGVAVPGWAPGTARDFEVVGWAAYVGHDFNPGWFTTPPYIGEMVAWGVSAVGTGVAGGLTGSGTLSSLSIFGGPTGIQQGFNIDTYTVIPEPSSVALAGFGAALLLFRRRV